MTDNLIAVLITLGILVLLALWVPCLHLCHRCVRKVMRRNLPISAVAAVLSLLPGVALGQLKAVNHITTVAGTGSRGYSGDGGPATSATLNAPTGIVLDGSGNVYVADTSNNVVRLLNSRTNTITTVAGNGTQGFAGDGGPAVNAQLNGPQGLALDTLGNLYIADLGNVRVRMVSKASGNITTVAGNGTGTYNGDGEAATNASIVPYGVATDAAGNLYIADGGNQRIRQVKAGTGVISTIAGHSANGFSGDGGAATSATLNLPSGLCVDPAGNVYFTDTNNYRVREVTRSTGVITTVAGGGTGGDGGPATSAKLGATVGVEIDNAGNLLFTDETGAVRKVDAATRTISTVAGGGSSNANGIAATQASLQLPFYLALDNSGNLFLTEEGGNLVREVSPLTFPATAVGATSTPQTLLLQTTEGETISDPFIPASQGGTQEYAVGTVTGCATDGKTFNPAGTICTVPITFSPAYPGQRPVPLDVATYVGDNMLRNVDFGLNGLGTGPLAALSPGIISTVAGNGTFGDNPSGDGGPATSANVQVKHSMLTVDTAGNLYFGNGGCSVWMVTASTGIINRIAGDESCGSILRNGSPAIFAGINGVGQIALDPAGNLFLADTGNNVIREVFAANGIITTFAGNAIQGGTGDGGPATSAELDSPLGLAFDSAGNLYISTQHTVRKVDAVSGIITTVVGTGAAGNTGDGGQAIAATLYNPSGLAIDSANNLYIADPQSHVVRKVSLTTGIISTAAGNNDGVQGSSGDGGPATSAELGQPIQVAVDAAGDLYIADSFNLTVRKVEASTGIISTVAGSGKDGGEAGPSPTQAGEPATAQDFATAYGVAVDGAGNTYISAFDYIYQVDTSTSALIYPTTTNVGSADTTDDPKSFTVSNIGNTNLQIPLNGTATDPVISSAWSVDPSSTCLNLSGSEYNLIPGKGCTFALDFTPIVGGANTGTLVLTDDSLNVATATQTVTLSGQGKASAIVAILSVSPTAISFPDTQAGGASASQTITVSSTGTATANITGITLTGANATSFSQTSNCGMTLASGSTCAITVTFTPQAATSGLSATVSVASNDPKSPATTTLTGNGLSAGSLTISPTAQAFPSTKVGQVSTAQTSTISNTTAQAIYLSSGSLTDATDFVQSDNCGGLVGAGKTCTVSFVFAPQSAGVPLTSTYAIHDLNNPNSPLTVSLSGLGASAGVGAITLTPSAVAFTTTAGVAAAGQSVTLTNTGTAQVTLGTSPISIGGTNATVFQGSAGFCGYTLAVGASCNASVAFTSTTVGTYTATFNATYFTSGTTTATASIPLTGTVTGSAQATLTPPALSFNTAAGTTPATQTATLTNNGTAALTISNVALSGANATSFSIASNNCGTTLAAGASCTLTLGFTATTVGSYSATLTVTDSASPTTQTVALTGSVTGVAQAALSPSALSFTTVAGTAPATQTATLTNNGTAALTISNVALSGANATSFSIAANNCGTTLAAGASCTLTLGFAATTVGSYSATLTVTDSASPTTQTVALTGTVTGVAQAALSPSSLSFTTVAGTAPANQTTTLTNNGTAALTINSVTLSGANATSFSIASNNCGTTLAAGASCTLTLGFTATTVGSYSATLTVTDSASPTTQTVALTGSVTGVAQAAPSPSSLSFTTVAGTAPATQTTTLTNNGTAALTISNVALSGANATSFSIASNNCGTTLAAGASCTLTLGFTATTVGSYSATLTVTDSASPTTQTVALTGTVTGVAQAALSPSALSFTTSAGTAPATQTTTLTNNGTAALTISNVALSGANATSFSIASNNCGTTLAAGASCTLTLGFTATTVGSYSATLTVTDSASPTTQTVALTGTVTGVAQAALSPSALSFTTSAGTAPATQTATLTNSGTAALTISSVALSGANATSFSIAANNCGTTLAAGASCTLTLGFTATTVGSYSATLTVTDSASPTTQTVALTGTVMGVARATLLPGTLTFTTVSGSTTAAQTATLSNPGSAALAITSIGLTGANATLFQAATNNCGPTLAAGASCTIGVIFSSTAVGSFNAVLSVVDAAGTQTTALNGTANAPPTPPDFTLTATPASQSSYRGRSVTYTLQLASLMAGNPFANSVTLSVSGLPSGVTASFSPASVIPGSATATSSLILTIPALVGTSAPQLPPGGRGRWPVEGVGLSVACLLGGAMLRRRRRMPRLLAVLLLCGLGGLTASITGCGSNTTGFGVPTSTSTILVTGTSGTTAHSTTVTLTIQ